MPRKLQVVAIRVPPELWREVKKLAKSEAVPIERVAECALVAFVTTAKRLRSQK